MSTDTDALPPLTVVQAKVVRRQIPVDERSAYDRVFWLTYLTNGLTTLANAMLVRYADFVNVLGGEERQLGLIVGVGMLGSIAMRLVQGWGIDRHGAARVWRWSMIVYSFSLFAHLLLTDAYSPGVFIARVVMQSSLAGIFGSSITFVSLRVTPPRMAEIIGTLGTSGFIGILVGPLISDWLCGNGSVGQAQVEHLFLAAGTVALASTVITWWATASAKPPTYRRPPPLQRIVQRYTPIRVAIVAVAMGAGFAIPFTFLRPFAAEMRIANIGLYFSVYALTAFFTRLTTRQVFERHGNRPWMILGMALLTLSFLLYLPVRTTWQLIAPGAVAGIAHALLFPSVMAAGTTVFPTRFRGVATSLMLAMFDLGTFIGAPVVGTLVQSVKRSHANASAYPITLACTAAAMLVVTCLCCLPWTPASRTRVRGSGMGS